MTNEIDAMVAELKTPSITCGMCHGTGSLDFCSAGDTWREECNSCHGRGRREISEEDRLWKAIAIIDVQHSRIEGLEAELKTLHASHQDLFAEAGRLREALQALYDDQNGPLTEAMIQAQAALAKHDGGGA